MKILLLLLSCCHLQAYELAVATMFRDEAKYLKEWIEYHRMLGVDHFYLYNDKSTDNWLEVLQPYIHEGLVDVTYWPSSSRINWPERQVEAAVDCFKRAAGVATWVACIDLDEFLLPMSETSLIECLNTHFSEASAVFANWRMFGTGGVTVPEGSPFLAKLIACSQKTHPENNVGKSIVRPDAVDLERAWYPHHFPLKDGHYVFGDGEVTGFDGKDLKMDGRTHDAFIRINHYVMRDENFFLKFRLPKAKMGWVSEERLMEHYRSFSSMQDTALIDLIREHYPDKFEEIWNRQ